MISVKTLRSMSVAVLLVGPSNAAEDRKDLFEQAYIYGLPIVMSYKTMYFYAIDKGGPEYKAPFNEIRNIARVYGPKDKAVVSPNSDTPYSVLWLDLQAEPVVLCVPKIEADRYYSVMLQDLSTNLLPYLGTRTTGNDGGCALVAREGWSGDKPEGVARTIVSPTDFVFTAYRTQLFNADDLDKVKAVQAGYSVQPLSDYLKAAPPTSPGTPDFPTWDENAATGDDLIAFLNFSLQFIQPTADEQMLLTTLEPIGVGAGKPFDSTALTGDDKAALKAGFAAAKKKIDAKVAALPAVSGNTADGYGGDWLERAATTQLGWGANAKEEAMYPTYKVDADGDALDGSQAGYRVTFRKDGLPPVDAFWSLTMYDGKTQLMIENPLDRYLVNSTMVNDMVMGDDRSLTLYIQNDAPEEALKANWLPAPDGPFYMLLRLYLPKQAILDGDWTPPAISKAN